MTSFGLSEVGLHSYDVTQQETCQPTRGIRRVIQKRSQLYNNKSNISGTILYGLSMSSSTALNIRVLCICFSLGSQDGTELEVVR